MSSKDLLIQYQLQRVAAGHVLVVGDVMLDRYVYGDAERLSPEAPVPVLKVARESDMLGGAGNVVRNLDALGATATLVSVIGDDAAGQKIRELLDSLARVRALLIVDRERRTSLKTRFVAGSPPQQLLRLDYESAMSLGERIEADVADQVASAVAEAAAVVLSDYGKGVLTKGVNAAAIAAARAARKPIIVDPKSRDYERYRGATLIAPNRKELAEASGLPTRTHSEVEIAASQIRESFKFEVVLATRGEDGMTIVDENGAMDVPTVEKREIFDVSGAGDTVIATVAAGLAGGLGLLDAARVAQCAARIVVGKPGTAVAHPEEIAVEMKYEDSRLTGEKILSRNRTVEQVERWQRRGLRIGFTNGCFDLVHPGHVHLIEKARAACDRLVVGLNSDASVRRLKGSGRPVQGEDDRAKVLAGLAAVHIVTVFAEDTPEALIAALRPNVLVKSTEYTKETVVGADFVESYGGEVLLVDLIPGHSTTRITKKVAQG